MDLWQKNKKNMCKIDEIWKPTKAYLDPCPIQCHTNNRYIQNRLTNYITSIGIL